MPRLAGGLGRQKFGIGRVVPGKPVTVAAAGGDADVLAWIAAVNGAGGSVSASRQALVENLVTGLKADGIWSKLDRLWLFKAENSQSALIDLVATATATATNSPTFTVDAGYTGNGTTSYLGLSFDPNTGSPHFTRNAADIIVWSNTSAAVSQDIIGTYADSSGSIYTRYADNHQYYEACGSQQQSPGTVSDGSGLFVATRTGASASALYRNGLQQFTGSESSASLVNANQWRACGGNLGSSAHECAGAGLGGGLSGTDQANLYTRLNTYMAGGAGPVTDTVTVTQASVLFTGQTVTIRDSSYVGPGHLVSGAVGWWGLRAYSAASIGSNAVRLREDGGNTEQDFATIAGGGLDLAAITTFKGANNLFVRTLYNQVAGTNHLVQATTSRQPKFILNALGSLPAMQDNGANSTLLASSTASVSGQPFTFSAVYKVLTQNDGMIAIGTGGAYPQVRVDLGGANRISISTAVSDPAITATASDGSWHALQAVFNGTSSDVNVDGSANVGTAVADLEINPTDVFSFGASSNFFKGYIGELGVWTSAFSAGASTSMSTNQHTYWGFGAVTDTITVTQASVVFTGKTVTIRDADVVPVLKASVTVTGKTVTILDRDVIPILKASVTVTGQTVTITNLFATQVIPVGKGDILFAGQPIIITDIGVQPPVTGLPGGGAGFYVPPWRDLDRKKRRRYRALEEIEQRLEQRIEKLTAETQEQQQQVAAAQTQIVVPDRLDDLLRQQAAVNAQLREAQRRAQQVREEKVQLAQLARLNAAEAADEDEAITLLLLSGL